MLAHCARPLNTGVPEKVRTLTFGEKDQGALLKHDRAIDVLYEECKVPNAV